MSRAEAQGRGEQLSLLAKNTENAQKIFGIYNILTVSLRFFMFFRGKALPLPLSASLREACRFCRPYSLRSTASSLIVRVPGYASMRLGRGEYLP